MKTVIFVGAHPDDDINAAGYLSQAAASGARVICIFLTRGEAGLMPHPDLDAAIVRTQEQLAAAEVIGITECIFLDFLGYRDGQCARMSSGPAIRALVTILTHYDPDAVITFDDGGLTGHDDHAVAGHVATIAHRRARLTGRLLKLVATEHFQAEVVPHLARLGAMMDPHRLRPVATHEVSLMLRIAGDLLAVKIAAYRAHRSQSLEQGLGPALLAWLGHEAYVEV